MIRLQDCDVVMPATLAEARSALSVLGARILGGGTDLIVSMKQGMSAPDRLVWLGKIAELRSITTANDGALHIGAGCTLAQIVASPTVRTMYPEVAAAANSVASPAIRTTATIGGNLCLPTRCVFYDQSEFWRGALGGCIKLEVPAGENGDVCHAAPGRSMCSAIFSSDTAPILMALCAKVTIAGHDGMRTIPLKELYRDDGAGHLTLIRGEILTEVVLPAPAPGMVSAHRKIRARGSVDYPLANIGVAMKLDANNVSTRVHIFVGAIHSMPVELQRSMMVLEGNVLDDANIARAVDQAAKGLHPIPNTNVTVGYRRKMIAALLERALRAVRS